MSEPVTPLPYAGPDAPPRRGGTLAWFLNPYAQIGVGAVLVTASELLLKKGATVPKGVAAAESSGAVALFGLTALGSPWTWGGIVCYVLSFISWLHVLRFVPLSVAFGLINVVHVLVPLGAWALLGESISTRRWLGITLVLAGIALVAKPVAKAEEKL